MECNKCKCVIEDGDEMQYREMILCEDCYMDAMSPTRTCDPWAVYTAKSCSDSGINLSEIQSKILQILKDTGGIKAEILAEKLNLDQSELQREVATLRHMEKLKAAMKDGEKILCLW